MLLEAGIVHSIEVLVRDRKVYWSQYRRSKYDSRFELQEKIQKSNVADKKVDGEQHSRGKTSLRIRDVEDKYLFRGSDRVE